MDNAHPRLRASLICPLCGGPKDKGLVCCWHCYRSYALRDGNPEAEARLVQTEEEIRLGYNVQGILK